MCILWTTLLLFYLSIYLIFKSKYKGQKENEGNHMKINLLNHFSFKAKSQGDINLLSNRSTPVRSDYADQSTRAQRLLGKQVAIKEGVHFETISNDKAPFRVIGIDESDPVGSITLGSDTNPRLCSRGYRPGNFYIIPENGTNVIR